MKKTVESGAACSQKALKISAKARYALRFVLDVAAHAGDEKPRTGAVIAAAQSISEKFLSRIVIPLREKGIVRSVRGNVGGGLVRREGSCAYASRRGREGILHSEDGMTGGHSNLGYGSCFHGRSVRPVRVAK